MRGSRTGVYIGVSIAEAIEAWSTDPETLVGYSMPGCCKAMFANRISFFFDFKGEDKEHKSKVFSYTQTRDSSHLMFVYFVIISGKFEKKIYVINTAASMHFQV